MQKLKKKSFRNTTHKSFLRKMLPDSSRCPEKTGFQAQDKFMD